MGDRVNPFIKRSRFAPEQNGIASVGMASPPPPPKTANGENNNNNNNNAINDISENKNKHNVQSAGGQTNSERGNWGNDIEFLMSCIAMSVGLGNVWRFPFTALENGGGAFLIPYMIVLLVIGRPLYYMEMIIGQFSSRGCIKALDMVPALRGKIFSVYGPIRFSQFTIVAYA